MKLYIGAIGPEGPDVKVVEVSKDGQRVYPLPRCGRFKYRGKNPFAWGQHCRETNHLCTALLGDFLRAAPPDELVKRLAAEWATKVPQPAAWWVGEEALQDWIGREPGERFGGIQHRLLRPFPYNQDVENLLGGDSEISNR